MSKKTPLEKPNRARLAELFRRVAGTQEGFAEAMTLVSGTKVTQQMVQNWLKRENVPSRWVRLIVQASDGKVRPEDIRPDVFGEPS